MRTTSLVSCLLLGLLGPAVRGADADPIAEKTREVLKAHCYQCHGRDGANEGGFNYVLDMRQLVARRKVVPGEPGKSRIVRRITSEDDPMPPAEVTARLSAEEIAMIKKWIEQGARPADETPKRAFLTQADVLQIIRDDLERAAVRDRRFLRYFTLTHLHNAGLSAEELQSYRHGLSKLINSLSWGKRIVLPRAVDADKTILAIDARDYQWNETIWDGILERNPYGILLDTDDFKSCALATRCRLPLVRADWFVATASRPPLYHQILQLPSTEKELERMLLVDVQENIRQERVSRAGFNGSGVSRNNRLIERHESGATVYWKSYDFGGNTGRQNLFAHPLGPGDSDSTFAHDGGEIIFSLPNGLQAYLLVDGTGRRIDKGPTAIVSDPRRPDRAVENGLSCMSCHARGIIEKTDQVRDHVLKNAASFTAATTETVQALYPPAERMIDFMRADAKRFQEAVARTGAPLSTTEPISALATRFEGELDLALVAAEAGVPATDLLRALTSFPHLAKQLGPLRVEGGTVQRQVIVDIFQELVEALRVGTYLPSRHAASDKFVREANALLDTDLSAALRLYTQARELEPDNPRAHAGQGDAFRLKGELAEAIAAYTEALRLDPRSALLLNNRGLTFQRRGELDKAAADFDAAVRLDPRFNVAYYNRGNVHFAMKDFDKAITDFSEALLLDSKSKLAFNNRGYAFFERGDLDRALLDFEQALKLDAAFASAVNNRGLVHLRKNRLAQAVGDFTAAIKADPTFAQAYFNRSVAFTRQGDKTRALEDRRRALALDPGLERD